MRWNIIFFLWIGLSTSAFAQQAIPRGSISQESSHFAIESDLSEAQTRAMANELEAAWDLFSDYFGDQAPEWLLRVRIFASYDAYLATLAAFPAEFNLRNRQDYLFLLNSTRPHLSVVLIYPQASDENPAQMIRPSLIKNIFLEYAFAVAPQMSPWLREGLALYFELATWNADLGQFELSENHTYLDRLQIVREQSTFTLEQLIALDDDMLEEQLESALAHAWAVVNFLAIEHPAVLRAIITRELAGDQNHPDLMALSGEITNYFDRKGFNGLMELGRLAIGEQRYSEAVSIFEQAAMVNPSAWSVHYYRGLAAFHLEDFDSAYQFYNDAIALGGEAGLLAYALGVWAMAQEDFALAETHFTDAESADRTRFSRHVAEQRAKIQRRMSLES
jgi:tetratricopeptide (TPR) repeat protein